MAFHIDTKPIEFMPTYQSAKAVFERLTPIRGGDQSLRRIGKRSDDTKWLKHEIHEGIDVYVAGFHRTNLVTYYPTHYKLSMRGWTTLSTRLFIQAVIGVPVYYLHEKDYVPKGFRVPFDWNILYNYMPIKSNVSYDFDYAHNPLSEMDKPPKYKINRKRMNEVRQVAKPFYAYIHTMDNLLGDMEMADKSYWDSPYRHSPSKVMEDINNQECWWAMFECLAWQTQGRAWNHKAGKTEYWRKPDAMKQSIEESLKVMNPQVLDVVN
jgi:hypothetical protein